MLDLTNVRQIRAILINHSVRIKKHYGQHFLISRKVIDAIINAAAINPNQSILEIGPGIGTLTVDLASHSTSVIAVEKDSTLINILKENLEKLGLQNSVTIVENDILKESISDLMKNNYQVVANLPYLITAPILWKLLHEETNKPQQIVVMIQKEVADRLLASPGDMTLLSVLAQFYCQVERTIQVKRTLFFPPPKVDSTVVKMNLVETYKSVDCENFFHLVKKGFASKRKKLKNNLKSLINNNQIEEKFSECGLSFDVRAQELSVRDWIKLYNVLYTKNR